MSYFLSAFLSTVLLCLFTSAQSTNITLKSRENLTAANNEAIINPNNAVEPKDKKDNSMGIGNEEEILKKINLTLAAAGNDTSLKPRFLGAIFTKLARPLVRKTLDWLFSDSTDAPITHTHPIAPDSDFEIPTMTDYMPISTTTLTPFNGPQTVANSLPTKMPQRQKIRHQNTMLNEYSNVNNNSPQDSPLDQPHQVSIGHGQEGEKVIIIHHQPKYYAQPNQLQQPPQNNQPPSTGPWLNDYFQGGSEKPVIKFFNSSKTNVNEKIIVS